MQRFGNNSLIRFVRDSGELVARVSFLVGGTWVIERVIHRFSGLPTESYMTDSIVLQLATRLVSGTPSSIVVAAIALTCAGAAIRYRSLGPCWSDLEYGQRIRLVSVIVASILAWFYASSPVNIYVGYVHGLDRVLLVALVPLLYWRPIFGFPFLLLLVSFALQSEVPIRGVSYSEPALLIRVLILATLTIGSRHVLLKANLRRLTPRGSDFVFVLCCMMAAFYWVPGYGKYQVDWFVHDRIYNLLPATYSIGWLGFLEPETIAAVARGAATFNVPMKVWTLLAEWGALLCLMHRNSMRFVLVAWMILHTGIFLISGICYWRWILLDATVLLVLFGRHAPRLGIFTAPHRVLSVILIAGGMHWFGAVRLSWLDVPANYAYRVVAEGSDGRKYRLPPRFFAPYDYHFTLGNFGTVVDAPTLRMQFGAAGIEVAQAFSKVGSPTQALSAEARLGENRFDARARDQVEAFLRHVGANWNERRRHDPDFGNRVAWWRLLHAPPPIWTFPRSAAVPTAVTLERIELHQVFAFFDGTRYHEIRDRVVLTVPLVDDPAP